MDRKTRTGLHFDGTKSKKILKLSFFERGKTQTSHGKDRKRLSVLVDIVHMKIGVWISSLLFICVQHFGFTGTQTNCFEMYKKKRGYFNHIVGLLWGDLSGGQV